MLHNHLKRDNLDLILCIHNCPLKLLYHDSVYDEWHNDNSLVNIYIIQTSLSLIVNIWDFLNCSAQQNKVGIFCMILMSVTSTAVVGTRSFCVWGIKGEKCISEGVKILKKIAENGWFLPFFSDGKNGGGAEPLTGEGGNASMLHPPWCHHWSTGIQQNWLYEICKVCWGHVELQVRVA